MKKFLFTLCLCLMLVLAFSTATLAAQSGESETQVTSAAQSDEASTETLPEEAQETIAPAPTEENPFLALYELLGTHLPELFSALSLLGACIIGFCYKKGLLPILRDGIRAIGAATKEWGESAETYAKDAMNICENANNSIQFVSSCIEKMQSSLTSVEEKIAALGDHKTESEILRELMRGQVDMLYDIFLSSSLPQFEKDRVGKRVEEMKRLLEATSGGESHANE